MKTDELIKAISADGAAPRTPIARVVLWAAGLGAAVAAAVFLMLLPVRPDFSAVLSSPRFLYKWVLTLTLVVSSIILVVQLARPQSIPMSRLLLLVAAPAVLAMGIVIELMTLPSEHWMPTLRGQNAIGCVILIPLLSAMPFAALFAALQEGAPSHPALAGAVAGIAAAGIGATLYASHCMDDSPLFIAAWYGVGVALMSGIGAILGARLLRW